MTAISQLVPGPLLHTRHTTKAQLSSPIRGNSGILTLYMLPTCVFSSCSYNI